MFWHDSALRRWKTTRPLLGAAALATLLAVVFAGSARADYQAAGDVEPNNGLAAAQGPTGAGFYDGAFSDGDDSDVYFFYATGPTTFRFLIRNNDPEFGPRGCSVSDRSQCEVVARLLTNAGRPVGGLREIPFGQTLQTEIQVPSAGRWFLDIFPANYGGTKTYTLGIPVNPAITDQPVASPPEPTRLGVRVRAKQRSRARAQLRITGDVGFVSGEDLPGRCSGNVELSTLVAGRRTKAQTQLRSDCTFATNLNVTARVRQGVTVKARFVGNDALAASGATRAARVT